MAESSIEVVMDCCYPLQLRFFCREALATGSSGPAEELVVLVPQSGVGTPVLLQRVPEPQGSKNRVHIDLVHDDVQGEVSRLESLGAHTASSGPTAPPNG